MIRGRMIIGIVAVFSVITLCGSAFGGLFETRIDYPGLYRPKGVVAADFNGDGRIDLAVANQGDPGAPNDSIAVLLNLGGGVFGPQIPLLTGEGPYAICAADLDGDGDPDLVAANRSGSTVTVLINNGSAAFTNTSSPTVGLIPTDVRAADVDRDGDLDLVVSNILTTNVSVLLNKGDGSFLAKADYPVSDAANSVCPADLNGDGYPDLAVGSPFGVDLLINNGNGTFHPGGQIGSGTSRNYVNAADFDGDGDADLVATDLPDDKLSVFLNNGDATFADAVRYTISDLGDQVDPADLDNDGDIDLAVSLSFTGQLAVLLNDGAGNFSIGETDKAGDRSVGVCAADFNGDGDIDVAVGNAGSNDMNIFYNNLYMARTVIDPAPMDFLYAYAIDPLNGFVYVGNFDPGHIPSDINPATVRINDSLVPSSMEIVSDHPDFEGRDAAKFTFDLREFVRGYGALWDIAAYPYTVSGDFSDGAPFEVTGQVVIYGFLAGDANGNGSIEIGDPVAMTLYLYHDGQAPQFPQVCDLNGNGGIDLGDALILINYIFRGGPPPEVAH